MMNIDEKQVGEWNKEVQRIVEAVAAALEEQMVRVERNSRLPEQLKATAYVAAAAQVAVRVAIMGGYTWRNLMILVRTIYNASPGMPAPPS